MWCMKPLGEMVAPVRAVYVRLVISTCLVCCAGAAAAQPARTADRAPRSAAQVSAGSYITTPDEITSETGQTVMVERGLIFVPENRRALRSRQIAVHFVRFPSVRPRDP